MGIIENPIIQGIITFFHMYDYGFFYGFLFGAYAVKKIVFLRTNAWVILLIAGIGFLLIWLNILNIGAIIETGNQIAQATGDVA